MKEGIYSKLEKDKSFKISYLKQTPWWKTLGLVPPVCLLFIGLLGIVYLLNANMLASWYVIPYLICFMVGTVWFKAGRKYIQNTAIGKEGSFKVCVAHPVAEREGYVYAIFLTDNHRHDKYYMVNFCKTLNTDTLVDTYAREAKKKSVQLRDEDQNTDFYLRAYFNNDITKRNPDWREKGSFPVLYIDQKYCPIIKKIDLI